MSYLYLKETEYSFIVINTLLLTFFLFYLSMQLVEEEGSMFKGQNSTAIAKMKTYYQSCMDIDTLEAQGTTELQQVRIRQE